MAGSLTDISLRKNAEERLLHDALHDALTHLPNRTLFLDRLGVAMARAHRQSENRVGCSAVLFLDVDRFKHVNDSLGHLAGDLVAGCHGETTGSDPSAGRHRRPSRW